MELHLYEKSQGCCDFAGVLGIGENIQKDTKRTYGLSSPPAAISFSRINSAKESAQDLKDAPRFTPCSDKKESRRFPVKRQL